MIFAVAALAVLVAANSYAAELKIGDDAPKWSGIIGTDDKEHGLSDFKDARAIVLVFTCNHCPVVQAYEDRLIALQKDYKSKGVQVVAVNVNNLAADRLDKMKVRAKGEDRKDKKPLNFPYLYDRTQKIGRDYGATVTPHVFLLCKDRKIAYMGAIDDNINPKQVKTHFLRDALGAVLAGKEPPKTATKAVGCSIKWDEEK
ncbi:MAG: hypothetical protein A2V70_08180 [Planctomycetes bacterium RBG_13_63_9]|nr:MAG: hypothetical protein A2V70_08180 [Planctomycetes bacterium RBG_13_63_9]